MCLNILGPNPYGRGGEGVFEPRVATMYPRSRTLITIAGTHYDQHAAYVEHVAQLRQSRNEPPLTKEERDDLMYVQAVDLIIHPNTFLIRPDPQRMDLVFEADEQLQEKVSKLRIRFMLAGNPAVHEAIKRRGELWRITQEPVSNEELIKMIRGSRMAIGGQRIYYHSPCTGTRMLTIQGLRGLADLNDDQLRGHLLEIQLYMGKYNQNHQPEVDFFLGNPALRKLFRQADIAGSDGAGVRALLEELTHLFADSVPPQLRNDDPSNIQWAQRMREALCAAHEGTTIGEGHIGLAPEFNMHIKWISGGHIEDALLSFDPIYTTLDAQCPNDEERRKDQRAREILFNFVRDHPDLEYINGGRIIESLSRSPRKERGHRDVYVFQMKERGRALETIKIVRIQKWDVCWRLDRGDGMERAIVDTEEYTEYTMDRALGCRRLGMNLNGPVVVGKIGETYQGKQHAARGRRIWTPYFERDYVHGIASDTIPKQRFQQPGYARRFARLLGRAAAPNLIVGRGDEDEVVFFDDGDEVIVENRHGLPEELVVTHHTGSFEHYQNPLSDLAAAYARPINRRASFLPDPAEFAQLYLAALIESFREIQTQYRSQRVAFDQLFHFRNPDPAGNFAFRWACVLKRLDTADIDELARLIESHFQLASEPAQTSSK